MAEDLKGCPFCGAAAKVTPPVGYFPEWVIGCVTCDVSLSVSSKSKEAATALWNTRHADPLTGAKLEMADAWLAWNLNGTDPDYRKAFVAAEERVFDLLVAKVRQSQQEAT